MRFAWRFRSAKFASIAQPQIGVMLDFMEQPAAGLHWLLILAGLGSGMMAGLFVAFSTFMMKALGSLELSEGMKAMQAINRFIIRPSFLVTFLGTGLLLILACYFAGNNHPSFWYLIAATSFYVATCLVSTMAFNVPLNNQLEALSADEPEGLSFWKHYLARWTLWNHVRSIACLICTLLVGYSLSLA